MIIEDLHWADSATAALIKKILEQHDPLPVFTLVTARSQDVIAKCSLPTPDLELLLPPLSPGDSRFLAQELAGEQLNGSRVDSIAHMGGGNPIGKKGRGIVPEGNRK